MEKRTIAQVAIAVLQEAKQPLTAAEITQVILDKGFVAVAKISRFTYNLSNEF